jgi:hypothetical protein
MDMDFSLATKLKNLYGFPRVGIHNLDSSPEISITLKEDIDMQKLQEVADKKGYSIKSLNDTHPFLF